MSLLLTIYFLFILTYAIIMWFAFYRVMLFAENKDLKGYSRRMTLVVLIVILFIILVTFLAIRKYTWDDTFDFWYKKIIPDTLFPS